MVNLIVLARFYLICVFLPSSDNISLQEAINYPFLPLSEPKPPPIPLNPCSPSPCGANSECQVVDGRPVCSCVVGMLGTPPYCRPECLIHADCPTKLACLNNKCRDPCVGSCGFNAQCTVINHQPVCSCLSGYQGDPFSSCSLTPGKILFYLLVVGSQIPSSKGVYSSTIVHKCEYK